MSKIKYVLTITKNFIFNKKVQFGIQENPVFDVEVNDILTNNTFNIYSNNLSIVNGSYKGILILDDYFWKGYAKIEENPAFAINQFLKEVNNKYAVVNFSKFQLFLRVPSKNQC